MLGCKQLNEDGVGHVEVGNNIVLFAFLCTDEESTCIICEESTEWEFAQVDDIVFWHGGCCVICQQAAVQIWLR